MSTPGKRANGNTASLTATWSQVWLLEAEGGERLAGHDLGGDAGDRLADHLGDERHRAAGARVDLEDVDVAVLDGELHVHQADDLQRQGQLSRLALESRRSISGRSECGGSEQAQSPEWMPASSMCSMMPATKTSVAVGQAVDIDLDGVAADSGRSAPVACRRRFTAVAHVAARAASIDRGRSPWRGRRARRTGG